MLKTVLRISVMFCVSVVLLRAAGKKEIAQLEINELVTSFMISEIACMPITDPEVPLFDAVIFSITVIVLEVLFSVFSVKFPFFKHLTVGSPDFLIMGGTMNKKALNKAKVSLSEIVSAMRTKGLTGIGQINYCIQEPDGSISIIPFDDKEQKDEKGLEHMLICDGRFNKTEMKEFGYTKPQLLSIIREKGYKSEKEIFYLGINDKKECFVISF